MKQFGLAIVCALLLAGCGSSKLIGDWEGTVGGHDVTDTFKGDGTWISKFEFSPHGMDPQIFLQITGKYEVHGDKITRTGVDIKVLGATPEQEAAFLKDHGADYKKSHTQGLQWKSDDELAIGSLGQAEVLTRIKN